MAGSGMWQHKVDLSKGWLLKGDSDLADAKRRVEWSIRINIQWRVCFEWRNGDAFAVEIADYH